MNTPSSEASELAINEGDYLRFCRYFEQSSGLVLGQGKEYLIRSRLAKLLRSHALPDFAELLRKLECNEPGVRDLVLDALRRQGLVRFDAHVLPGHRLAKNFFEAGGFSARSIVMHHDDER